MKPDRKKPTTGHIGITVPVNKPILVVATNVQLLGVT